MAADAPSTMAEADKTVPALSTSNESSSTTNPETSQQEKVNTDVEDGENAEINTGVVASEYDYLTGIKLYGVAAACVFPYLLQACVGERSDIEVKVVYWIFPIDT